MELHLVRTRLAGFLQSGMFWNIVHAFSLKGVFVLLGFIQFALAARTMDAETFGQFSIFFSLTGLFATFATAGQQIFVMRFWNEYSASQDPGYLKGALQFSMLALLAGITLFGLPVFLILAVLYSISVSFFVSGYLVLLAVVLVTSHLVRTVDGIVTGDGVGIVTPMVFPVIYLLYCLWTGQPGSLDVIFALMCLACVVAITFHVLLMRRKIRALFPDFSRSVPRMDVQVWKARSLKLWLTNGLEATNQYMDVIVIGILLNPATAGIYFIVTRLANLFYIVADAMYFVSSRYIPNYYFNREFGKLDQLLNQVAKILALAIAGGLLVVVAGGQWMLLAFGENFGVHYYKLLLLCLGTASIALAGPSNSILLFTGHEGRSLQILFMTVALRLFGFFLLVPLLGIWGAVAGTTVSLLFMAVMARNSAQKLAELDGSVMRLL